MSRAQEERRPPQQHPDVYLSNLLFFIRKPSSRVFLATAGQMGAIEQMFNFENRWAAETQSHPGVLGGK